MTGNSRSFWLGLGYGLMLGVIGAGFGASFSGFTDWLYRWQTLIAGILAVLVGSGTIFYLRQQIKQTNDASEETRKRKDVAARALLPHALDDIDDYALRCIKILLPLTEGEKPGSASIACPLPPRDALIAIRDAVEYANEKTTPALAALAAWTQVQAARVRDGCNKYNEESGEIGKLLRLEIRGYIADTVELHARAGSLFDYSRRISEGAERINLRNSAVVCGLNDLLNSEILKALEGRQAKIDACGGGLRKL